MNKKFISKLPLVLRPAWIELHGAKDRFKPKGWSWRDIQQVAACHRALNVYPHLALSLETRRARSILRQQLWNRAIGLRRRAASLFYADGLWRDIDMTGKANVKGIHDDLMEMATKFDRAAVAVDKDKPEIWPVLRTGQSLPMALTEACGGSHVMNNAEGVGIDSFMCTQANELLGHLWRLHFDPHMMDDDISIVDEMADLSDREFEDFEREYRAKLQQRAKDPRPLEPLFKIPVEEVRRFQEEFAQMTGTWVLKDPSPLSAASLK